MCEYSQRRFWRESSLCRLSHFIAVQWVPHETLSSSDFKEYVCSLKPLACQVTTLSSLTWNHSGVWSFFCFLFQEIFPESVCLSWRIFVSCYWHMYIIPDSLFSERAETGFNSCSWVSVICTIKGLRCSKLGLSVEGRDVKTTPPLQKDSQMPMHSCTAEFSLALHY